MYISALSSFLIVGRLYVNKSIPSSYDEIEPLISFVNHGGWYKPNDCTSIKNIAIIIPYRDRKENLMVLLRHLNPILKRQKISYQVYIVEQVDKFPFNKGKLLNIGYSLAKQNGSFNCFVFHDADFLLADDRNRYDCPASPRHMSPICEKFEYTKHSESYFGGVIAVTGKDFQGKS